MPLQDLFKLATFSFLGKQFYGNFVMIDHIYVATNSNLIEM